MWNEFITFMGQTSVLNNIILMGFFVGFGILFFLQNNDTKSPVNWIDLLIDNKTKKLSLSKLGQFWGIAISSWVIIFMSQVKDAYTIFPSVFTAYLAFVGGVWGWKEFIKAKFGESKKDE